jgi:hypothetical protein
MDRAGDCCRLDMTLGRTKLLRFLSRELATRFNPDISAAGESARRGPDRTEECTLVSLSAPASLSKCIDWRLFWVDMLIAPACERGVAHPLGLSDRLEPATEDSLRPTRAGSDTSDTLRRACAIAEGVSKEPGKIPSSPVGISFVSVGVSVSTWSSSEELSTPAAI